MRLPVILLIVVSICQFSFKLHWPFASANTTCIKQGILSDSLPQDTLSVDEMQKMDASKVESVVVDRDNNVVHIHLKDGKYYVVVITKELENRADSSKRAQQADFRHDQLADTAAIRTKVDIESSYPGGMGAWSRFLQKTLNYPDEAWRKEIKGVVIVQFIVGVDGRVRDIQAVSGPNELRAEAVRVISKSGYWTPAVDNGVKVESYKKQPLVFKLESR